MSQKKNRKLDPEIEEYVLDFAKKIEERELEHFWVICDRADFKTHKNMLFRDMEAMFAKKKEHYQGKKVAEFNIVTETGRNYFTTIGGNTVERPLITIRISILTVGENGKLLGDKQNSWETTPIFYEADLKMQKVTVKLLERLMRAVAKKHVVGPAFGGITFRDFVDKLAKKGLALEEMDP